MGYCFFFKISCIITVIKTDWNRGNHRYIDKRNKIETPEINTNIYGHLVYDKDDTV